MHKTLNESLHPIKILIILTYFIGQLKTSQLQIFYLFL